MGNWADVSNKPTAKRGKKAAKSTRKSGTWDADSQQGKAIFKTWTEFRPYVRMGDRELSDSEQASVSRLTHSAKMVQTFVDALSGEQSNYNVGIDPKAQTASTDLAKRQVRLPAKVILDPNLSEEEAALLMVAYLMHEVGHIRFDDALDVALRNDVNISLAQRAQFNTLSVILRESRVEAGVSTLFPGYSGLFEPLLRWISRDTKDGSVPPTDALGFAIASTRYPFRFDWSNPVHQTERDWWAEWVAKNQWFETYPEHKAALDEAMAHILANLPKQPDQPEQGQPEQQPQQAGVPMPGLGDTIAALMAGSSLSNADADAAADANAALMDAASGKSANAEQDEAEDEAEDEADEDEQDEQDEAEDEAESDAPYKSVAAKTGSISDVEQAYNKIQEELREQYNDARLAYSQGQIGYDEYRDRYEDITKQGKKAKAARTKGAAAQAKIAASIPASIEEGSKSQNAEALARGGRGRGRYQAREQQANMNKVVSAANSDLGMSNEGAALQPMIEKQRGVSSAFIPTDEQAVSIFRSMFMSMRGGFDGRIGNRRHGRLEDGKVWRLADRGDDRVFTRRGAPKTQRLRAYVMVDVSGSMSGPPIEQARSVAKALVEASVGASNLHLEVFGWDTMVYNAYAPGDDPDSVGCLFAKGSTDDAGAIKWAKTKINQELGTEEHGLIILLSDGDGAGMRLLRHEVEAARETGLSVFGVGIGQGVELSKAYGEDAWVPFRGSVADSAEPLAEIIKKAWVSQDQRRA